MENTNFVAAKTGAYPEIYMTIQLSTAFHRFVLMNLDPTADVEQNQHTSHRTLLILMC